MNCDKYGDQSGNRSTHISIMSGKDKRHPLFLSRTLSPPLIYRTDKSLESRGRKNERPAVDSLALGVQFIDKSSDHAEITSASPDSPEEIFVL